jgi:hypothetical protein
MPDRPHAESVSDLRVLITDLPEAHAALAQALGEAGVGGVELERLFASGVTAGCVACGLSVTGSDLGDLALHDEEEMDRRLPERLERIRLGYCPRQGCESRFFRVDLTAPGRFDREWVLGWTRDLIRGVSRPRLRLASPLFSDTTRRLGRLAGIGLATLLVAFVAYRLIFFRSQPIPFIQPKSPYTVEPASIDPHQR